MFFLGTNQNTPFSVFEQLPIFQDVSDPAFVELTIAGITFAPYLWYVGVMQPENMLIHMTQNTFNYFSSCIFWFFLMAVTQVGRIWK